ncbi:restriction endonuclease, partial [Klosneuvirus KNV1]
KDDNKKTGLVCEEKPFKTLTYDVIKKNNWSLKADDEVKEDIKKGWIKLGDIITMLPTTKTCTSEGKNIGKYRFYNSSQTMKLYLDTYEIDKESIIIGNGGNVNIHYDTYFTPTKHVTVCHIKDKNMYNTKCIYYYLYLNIHKLISKSDGGGLKWLNKTNIASIIIPTLSLSHQKEIVELLDKEFQKYDINKLSNVINDTPIFNLLINKQYDDFKDLLFMIYKKIQYNNMIEEFEREKKVIFKYELMNMNCEEKHIKEVCKINDKTFSKKELSEMTYINYVDISSIENNKINTKTMDGNFPSRAIRQGNINDIIISSVRPALKCIAIIDKLIDNMVFSSGFYILSPNNTVNTKYLYNYLLTDEVTNYLDSKSGGNAYPSFNRVIIDNVIIKIPSLEDQNKLIKQIEDLDKEQNHIITICDKIQETIKFAFEQIKKTQLDMNSETKTYTEYPLSSFTKPITQGINQTITSPTKTKEFKYPYYTPNGQLYCKSASFFGKHLLITRDETNQGSVQAVDGEFSASSGIYVIKLQEDYESYYDTIKQQLENDFDFKKLIEEQPIIVKSQKSKLIGKTHLEDFTIKIQEESTEENQVESDEEKPTKPSEEHQDEQLDESSDESIKKTEEKPKETIPQKPLLNPKLTTTTKPQNNTKTQPVKPLNQKVIQNAKKKNITIA